MCLSNNPELEGDLNTIFATPVSRDLAYLYLDGPAMTFPDAVDFGAYTDLERLVLNGVGDKATSSGDALMTGISSLTGLNVFSMYGSSLGGLPDLSSSAGLQIVLAQDTQLTGGYPSWLATTSFPSMIYIYLNANNLTGELPTDWSNTPNLSQLYL